MSAKKSDDRNGSDDPLRRRDILSLAAAAAFGVAMGVSTRVDASNEPIPGIDVVVKKKHYGLNTAPGNRTNSGAPAKATPAQLRTNPHTPRHTGKPK
jgi:hypothetical protein